MFKKIIFDICKDVIHKRLKGSGGIHQAKGNHIVIEGSEFATEGYLPFTPFLDLNQMVCSV
jgi:hypothetical protein